MNELYILKHALEQKKPDIKEYIETAVTNLTC